MTERTPQQTPDLVRERMFANDRASKALGMRVVEMSPGQ
ncbi:MAG: phenylacetic acid degradation protein PaaD, partial [Betaproteobacteria bacterium]